MYAGESVYKIKKCAHEFILNIIFYYIFILILYLHYNNGKL